MAEATASGATPSTTATEASSTPQATAPAAARSLTDQQPNYDDRARSAKSPADIRAIIRDAKNAKPATPVQEAPPAPPAGETPAAEAAPAAEAPEGETAPEETAAAEGEAATTETPASETEAAPTGDDGDEGDGPVSPSTAKKLRLRLPENDQVGRLAAALLQRNRDWTLGEAYAAAQKQLGVKPEQQQAAETPKADPAKPALPTSIEAVDQAIENFEAEREKALTELRFEDVAKIDRQIRTHDRHRLNLEREAERTEAKRAAEYSKAFEASDAKAVELYPQAADPESPFGQRMREIESEMETLGDPLFNSPDKPLKIAQMVAAEMNIAPRRKGTPVAPAKAAAPATAPTPAKPKQVLPSGGSRTAPAPNPTTAIQSQVAGIKSVHEIRKFLKTVGASR